MKRRILMATAMAVILMPFVAAQASAQRLNASEIEELLAGSTITGSWGGDRYQQYYDPDGTTIYVPNEGRREQGQWQVNAEQDVYESWWRSSGWVQYTIRRLEDGGYAWINGDRLEMFTVSDGRQIE